MGDGNDAWPRFTFADTVREAGDDYVQAYPARHARRRPRTTPLVATARTRAWCRWCGHHNAVPATTPSRCPATTRLSDAGGTDTYLFAKAGCDVLNEPGNRQPGDLAMCSVH